MRTNYRLFMQLFAAFIFITIGQVVQAELRCVSTGNDFCNCYESGTYPLQLTTGICGVALECAPVCECPQGTITPSYEQCESAIQGDGSCTSDLDCYWPTPSGWSPCCFNGSCASCKDGVALVEPSEVNQLP